MHELQVPILWALTTFYTGLLILPSTPLLPTLTINLSLLFTVLLPILFAVAVVTTNTSPPNSILTSFSPAWNNGTLANHNFCEEDYRYTQYIAEFHNTWSSLPIIFYGGLGPYYTRKYATKELRFSCSFISIGAVGVGSTLFHGTLMRFGQVLDEVPMLCIIFVGVFCFVENQTHAKYGLWFPLLLAVMCISLVVAYLIFYIYSLFLVAFSGGVVLLLIRGILVLKTSSKLSATILKIAAMSIVVGFTCWMSDDRWCSEVQWMRLHIGWHIGTGFGGYMFTLFLLSVRANKLGKEAHLVVTGFDFKGHWINKNNEYVSSGERPSFLLPYIEFSSLSQNKNNTKQD
jgi:dihydroceramidase